MKKEDVIVGGEKAAGKSAGGPNPLFVASGSEFTEALNRASVEELRAAVQGGLGDAKRRGRLAAALRVRCGPFVGAADEAKVSKKRAAGDNPAAAGAAAAKRENARMADERSRAKDGQTASERAMASSAPAGKSAADLRRGGKPKAGGKKAVSLKQGLAIAKSRAAAKPKGGGKSTKLGGLGAVARVLCESGRPMKCDEMVAVALKKGLWSSKGKTPAATIYSAIIREISARGKGARFRKVASGTFAITAAGKVAVGAGRCGN